MKYEYEIYYEYESRELPDEVVGGSWSREGARSIYETHRRRPRDHWEPKMKVRIRRRPIGKWEVVR